MHVGYTQYLSAVPMWEDTRNTCITCSTCSTRDTCNSCSNHVGYTQYMQYLSAVTNVGYTQYLSVYLPLLGRLGKYVGLASYNWDHGVVNRQPAPFFMRFRIMVLSV